MTTHPYGCTVFVMPNRDTYDIEEAEKLDAEEETRKSINVQPDTLVKAMISSERCLFSNQTDLAITPRVIDPMLYFRFARMHQIAKWHAKIQVDFDYEMNDNGSAL